MPSYARILMTGASGFVGRRLAPALRAAYPAAALAAIVRGQSDTCVGWTTFCVDLADASGINEVVCSWRPDLVVHLAAQSSAGEENEFVETTWRTNGVGALNLACAVARTVQESIVFNVSTGEVYGSNFVHGPASEATPLSPRSVYARSKAAAETIFEDVLPPKSRLLTVRPVNHTGAGQDERFVLPSFAAQIARIEAELQPPTLRVGNLDVEREFLDVRDVIDAYLLILAGAPALPPRAVFNVASGQPRRIGDLLDVMVRASARSLHVEIDPARLRPGEVPRSVGDAAALRRHFGWTPKRSVEEVVVELLAYWRAQIRAETVATLPAAAKRV
jgi:GDP-4-dehydro-6-deoxy-D-mannose reductase